MDITPEQQAEIDIKSAEAFDENTLTEGHAAQLYNAKFWEGMAVVDRAKFQINEPILCMPFDVFHEAVSKAAGYPVFTHEFAELTHLRDAMGIDKRAWNFEEVLSVLTPEKRTQVLAADPQIPVVQQVV